MNRTFIVIFLLSCLSISGQKIEGLWYSDEFDYFLQFEEETCHITNRWYKQNDTIGYYRNDHEYGLKRINGFILLKEYYYIGGPAFWRHSDRTKYALVQNSNEQLLLRRTKSKPRNERGLPGTEADGESISLRKVEIEFYEKHTDLEYRKYP